MHSQSFGPLGGSGGLVKEWMRDWTPVVFKV